MTYYDDGFYDKKDDLTLALAEVNDFPEEYIRVYKLCDGDIFSINNVFIEYENNIFYEIVYSGYVDEFYNKEYKRTGKKFTIEELNNLVR